MPWAISLCGCNAAYRVFNAMNDVPDIPSPCIGVCQIDHGSRLCIGCMRTPKEIARWPYASPDERLDIVQQLKQRRRAKGITSSADQRPRRRQRKS